jgi:hypothetical protein
MASIILNNLPFDQSDLDDPVRNIALGRFMTAWSQAEVVWGFLFRKFLDLDYEVSSIVFDNIGVKEQLEIVSCLAEFLKNDHEVALLKMVTDEVKSISVMRNKIVHSSWGLFDGEPARFWRNLTSANFEEVQSGSQRGKSYLGSRIFTVTSLNLLTERTVKAREALEEALETIHPEPGPHGKRMAEWEKTRAERLAEMRAKHFPPA